MILDAMLIVNNNKTKAIIFFILLWNYINILLKQSCKCNLFRLELLCRIKVQRYVFCSDGPPLLPFIGAEFGKNSGTVIFTSC